MDNLLQGPARRPFRVLGRVADREHTHDFVIVWYAQQARDRLAIEAPDPATAQAQGFALQHHLQLHSDDLAYQAYIVEVAECQWEAIEAWVTGGMEDIEGLLPFLRSSS